MGIPVVSESAVVDLVAVSFLQSKGIKTALPEERSKLANAIAGAVNQFFTPPVSGIYCVVVSNDIGCADTHKLCKLGELYKNVWSVLKLVIQLLVPIGYAACISASTQDVLIQGVHKSCVA